MPPPTTLERYVHDLEFRGVIQGVTIKDKSSGKSLCHYFGGIPYAQPPVGDHRWKRPRELAPCYRYGTQSSPGVFDSKSGVCPQSGASKSNTYDEDCLQCNVWIPTGERPRNGWPVYFFIHGGFLQYGSPNSGDPVRFISEVSPCIVVKPGYRLNVLGFLASADVPGNFGFWDIRLALEWTYKNISYLGGNPRNITVGGYSAGAQAAFHQLSYDLVQPIEKRLIRRVIMHSNGPGLQPKSVKEAQTQFNELLSVIGIGKDAPNKMDLLRQTTAIELVKATQKMKFHQFRAVSDGEFVRKDLFAEITDGTFGKRLLENNVMLLIGECADEHFAYGRYKTPGPSYNALSARFQADYPKEAVKSIMKFYFPDQKLPARWKDWNEAFGKVYANMQIHVSERGFINGLVKGGATDLIDRYRIEWRAECADETSPRSFGATHGSDMPIWWYGDGRDLTFQEQSIVRKALLGNLAQFIAGKKMNWETNGPYQIRRFKADGSIDITTDPLWNEALEDWKSVGFGIVDLPIGKARF